MSNEAAWTMTFKGLGQVQSCSQARPLTSRVSTGILTTTGTKIYDGLYTKVRTSGDEPAKQLVTTSAFAKTRYVNGRFVSEKGSLRAIDPEGRFVAHVLPNSVIQLV